MKSIDLQTELPSYEIIHTMDPKIEKIFAILILNVIQSTPENGNILSISDNPERTYISVSDTSRGISKDHLYNLIDKPESQADKISELDKHFSHFSKIFKKRFGCNPSEYKTTLLIGEAKLPGNRLISEEFN